MLANEKKRDNQYFFKTRIIVKQMLKTFSAYLSVKRLVDVHSIVLTLFNEHVPALPDKSCRRVGVDGAAQEHRLLLVVTTTHIADGLVHRQDGCVEV